MIKLSLPGVVYRLVGQQFKVYGLGEDYSDLSENQG